MTPIRIRFCTANAYLVASPSGYTLIDTGDPGFTFRLFQTLARSRISPGRISLIVLTHIHFDHIGGLWAIQAQSGAPVLVHQQEAADLAAGRVIIPPGIIWPTRLLAWMGQKASRRLRFPGYQAQHIMSGAEMSLTQFGLAGRLLHTPGHSPGSISLILDNGAAFTGDICPNTWFNTWQGTHFPPYADDMAAVYESWQTVLNSAAQTIYPGHGKPFPVEVLRQELQRVKLS